MAVKNNSQTSVLVQSKFMIPYFYSQEFLKNLPSDHEREIYMKKESPFQHHKSFQLRPFILKSDVDIRQESFFIHLISIFKRIFKNENLNIYLRDLDFILLGKGTCMIEYIKDSESISTLKKNNP